MRSPSQLLLFPKSYFNLFDTFSTPTSTGNVNNTVSDNGQLRNVVDGNNKLSISGGLLTFVTGGVAGGNPGLWYPGHTRQPGQVYFVTVTPNTAAATAGLDANQSGSIQYSVQFLASGFVRMGVSTVTVTTGIAYSNGTAYRLAFIERNVGIFTYIKGGAYTNWTLVWIINVGAEQTLYPAIAAFNTTGVFTADDARSPNTFVGMPIPTLSDSFNRANGVLGSTDGLSTSEGNGVIGLAWNGSTWTIVSNAAVNTPTAGSELALNPTMSVDANWTKGTGWSIAAGVASHTSGSQTSLTQVITTLDTWYKIAWDLTAHTSGGGFQSQFGSTGVLGVARTGVASYIETGRAGGTTSGIRAASNEVGSVDNVSIKALTLSTLFSSIITGQANDLNLSAELTIQAGTQAGLVMNLDSESSPSNFVLAYHDGVNAKLDKCVAGVYTSVISAAATYSAGARIVVVKIGSSYSLYYNELQVGSTSTISDAGIVSNTKHGLFSTDARNSLDNVTGYPVEYRALDTIYG